MGLSNQQIERYARQIIVPGVGGIAQERLLAARMMLAGKADDIASALAYLVGAGVGEIQLLLPASDAAAQESLITQAARLNSDTVVKPAGAAVAGLNLVLALASNSETSSLILTHPEFFAVPLIFCRLDEPPRIAILTAPPPCLSRADADLLGPSKRRSENAGFVAMIAAAEAFKLLALATPPAASMLLEFNGFACTTRQLAPSAVENECR
jgi:hypothetical protein